LSISGLLFAEENISLDSKISVKVLKDNCDTYVRIISIAGENADIKLD
jgi:hypothetical protein